MPKILSLAFLALSGVIVLKPSYAPPPRTGIRVTSTAVTSLTISHGEMQGRCSGFYISPDIVVTAAHCTGKPLDQILDVEGAPAYVIARGKIPQLNSKYTDNAEDWAILRVKTKSQYWFKLAAHIPEQFELGFLLSMNPERRAFPAVFLQEDPNTDTLLITSYVRLGDSGGPFVDKAGDVYGIMSVCIDCNVGRDGSIVNIAKVAKRIKELHLLN